MREVLDRLREAETALDKELRKLYYATHAPDRKKALHRLWKAKQHLWYAQMYTLNAAVVGEPIGDD